MTTSHSLTQQDLKFVAEHYGLTLPPSTLDALSQLRNFSVEYITEALGMMYTEGTDFYVEPALAPGRVYVTLIDATTGELMEFLRFFFEEGYVTSASALSDILDGDYPYDTNKRVIPLILIGTRGSYLQGKVWEQSYSHLQAPYEYPKEP